MTVVYFASEIQGLAADTKPSNVAEGRIFLETDTAKRYRYTSGSWVELAGAAGVDPNTAVVSNSTTIGDYSTPVNRSVSSQSVTTGVTETFSPYDGSTDNGFYANQRYGIEILAGSSLIGKTLNSAKFKLRKTGSSGGDVFVYIRLYNSSNVLQGTFDTIYHPGLSSTYSFRGGSSYSRTLQQGDYIVAEHTVAYQSIIASDTDADGTTNGIRFAYYNGSTWSNPSGLPIFEFQFDAGNSYNVLDDNTATTWSSNSETNPYVYIDTGASQYLTNLAYHHNNSTTETEIKIQTSSDGTTWTDKRTITISNLTNGAWNYIRFPTTLARYIRIYGNSGSSAVLSINQLKWRSSTESTITITHGHLAISSSDTSLNLDGT